MLIRPATQVDWKSLAALDDSYTTEYVWQMQERTEGEEIIVNFRTIKLPRPLRVSRTKDAASLFSQWASSDLLLMAEQEGEVWGYLELRPRSAERGALIANLVITPNRRRQGVATALIKEARGWAKAHRLRSLFVETQTKNYPAIRLCQKCGFLFCGFDDHHYSNRDIAVFFVSNL
ncbi:MAG: GNAT family N-acetyltransferase [Chloroflexi bacterium]|nr:GNAT family N-acetyltransferase [Chloroflexota bacterium]